MRDEKDENEYLTDLFETIDNWTGFNRFYFKGWFLTGPSGFKPLLSTSVFILVPYILLMIFNSTVNKRITII